MIGFRDGKQQARARKIRKKLDLNLYSTVGRYTMG
jgi:hypothetical protein